MACRLRGQQKAWRRLGEERWILFGEFVYGLLLDPQRKNKKNVFVAGEGARSSPLDKQPPSRLRNVIIRLHKTRLSAWKAFQTLLKWFISYVFADASLDQVSSEHQSWVIQVTSSTDGHWRSMREGSRREAHLLSVRGRSCGSHPEGQQSPPTSAETPQHVWLSFFW